MSHKPISTTQRSYASFSINHPGVETLLYNSPKKRLPYVLRIHNFKTANNDLYNYGKYYIKILKSGTYKLSCKGYIKFQGSAMNFNVYCNDDVLKRVDIKSGEHFRISVNHKLKTGDRIKFKLNTTSEVTLRKISKVRINFGVTKNTTSSKDKHTTDSKDKQTADKGKQVVHTEQVKEKVENVPEKHTGCNMLVTEYNYVKSGITKNETLTVSGKRYDRVLQNPAYNMMLYIWHDIYSKLSSKQNPYSTLTKDSCLIIPNLTVEAEDQLMYTFRFIPAFISEAFVRKIELSTGTAIVTPDNADFTAKNEQLYGNVYNASIDYESKQYLTYVNKVQGIVSCSPEMIMLSMANIFDMFVKLGYNANAAENINTFMKNIYDHMDYKPYRPLNKGKDVAYNRMIVNSNTRLACQLSHVFDNETSHVVFDNTNALRIKGGDITSTSFEHYIQPNIVYKTTYHIDLNVNELYEVMCNFVKVLRTSLKNVENLPNETYIRSVFKKFGFPDVTYKPPKYNELQAAYERSNSEESINVTEVFNKIDTAKNGAILYKLEQVCKLKQAPNLQYWSKYYLNEIDFSTTKQQDEIRLKVK